jgi:hypothetical protein
VNFLRIAFALAGFVLALISIALNDSRLGWAAIAVLLISVIARLILRKRIDATARNAESEGDSPL